MKFSGVALAVSSESLSMDMQKVEGKLEWVDIYEVHP